MLRMNMISSAQQAMDYFRRALSPGEYYAHARSLEQERVGSWGGQLAQRLDIHGDVGKTAFDHLCQNLHPVTGNRLTQKMAPNRRVGYDINFHVPKSVSLAVELGGDDRIVDSFREAVRETMQEMEQDVHTRVRKGGADTTRQTGSIAWAEFVHFTARPVGGSPDPHLHSHNIVFNATWDEVEQQYKAADLGLLMRDAPYFQAVFHARLKTKIAELGYRVERRGKGWEIAGVPERMIKAFSRRTQEIEQLAKDRGIKDPVKKADLGAHTRENKMDDLSMDQLRSRWRVQAGGDDLKHMGTVIGRAQIGNIQIDDPEQQLDRALQAALDHIMTRRSAVRNRDLIAETLTLTTGGVLPADVERRISKMIEAGELHQGSWEGEPLLVTPEVYQQEQDMLAMIHDGNNKYMPLVAGHQIIDQQLSVEQRIAVEHVLGSTDMLAMIRGRAGVGKTKLMHEVVGALESKGIKVQPVAIGAKITDEVLRKDGFKNAVTVAKWLHDETLQKRIRGGVLWVDEAGQVGVPDLDRILRLAQKLECRVLLTGDTAQHHAVQRGDAMKIIETFGHVIPAEVRTIRRQRCEQYREACSLLSDGKIVHGFAELEKMGSIKEIQDHIWTGEQSNERARYLASVYLESAKRGRDAMVISPTHAEGNEVTKYIRQSLKDHEKIGTREKKVTKLQPRQLTDPQKTDAAIYRTGDIIEFSQSVRGGTRRGDRAEVTHANDERVKAKRQRDGVSFTVPLDHPKRIEVYEQKEIGLVKGDQVRFTKNGNTQDKKHKVLNGSNYTLDRVGRDGTMHLENGWKIDKDFGHINYGYCVTSHAAEGATSDLVIIAQSAMSSGASSAQQFYTSATRGRDGVLIVTDDKDRLREWVQKDASRVSAMQAMDHKPVNTRSLKPTREVVRDEMNKEIASRARAHEQSKVDRQVWREQSREHSLGRNRDIDRDWSMERDG